MVGNVDASHRKALLVGVIEVQDAVVEQSGVECHADQQQAVCQ